MRHPADLIVNLASPRIPLRIQKCNRVGARSASAGTEPRCQPASIVSNTTRRAFHQEFREPWMHGIASQAPGSRSPRAQPFQQALCYANRCLGRRLQPFEPQWIRDTKYAQIQADLRQLLPPDLRDIVVGAPVKIFGGVQPDGSARTCPRRASGALGRRSLANTSYL